MWLATTRGFYSVVRNRDAPSFLLVRARAREDLERLCELDSMGKYADEIVETQPADYDARIWRVMPDDWNAAVEQMTDEMTYTNFKNAIHDVNPDRARTYMGVWLALLDITTEGEPLIPGSELVLDLEVGEEGMIDHMAERDDTLDLEVEAETKLRLDEDDDWGAERAAEQGEYEGLTRKTLTDEDLESMPDDRVVNWTKLDPPMHYRSSVQIPKPEED